MKVRKIAIDIHGVLDANPEYFVDLAFQVIQGKGEVHILTGSEWSKELEKELLSYASYRKVYTSHSKYWTHFASVITILKESGAQMYFNKDRGHWCVSDNEIWDRVKGDYCREHGITEIYDDTIEYRKYMPEFTSYFLYSHNPVEHELKLKKKHLNN